MVIRAAFPRKRRANLSSGYRYMTTTADSQSLAGTLLVEHQRLATSGARAVLPFHTDLKLRLSVPQLAVDIPGTPPHMNARDSNVDIPLYRWSGGRFVIDGRLPVPAAADAPFFQICGPDFLPPPTLLPAASPYHLNFHP